MPPTGSTTPYTGPSTTAAVTETTTTPPVTTTPAEPPISATISNLQISTYNADQCQITYQLTIPYSVSFWNLTFGFESVPALQNEAWGGTLDYVSGNNLVIKCRENENCNPSAGRVITGGMNMQPGAVCETLHFIRFLQPLGSDNTQATTVVATTTVQETSTAEGTTVGRTTSVAVTTAAVTDPATASTTAEAESSTTQVLCNVGGRPVFTSESRQLKVNGARLNLKATNWYGFETNIYAPHGCWTHQSVDACFTFMMDFLQDNDFNGLRVPLSLYQVKVNPVVSNYP